MFEFSVDDFMFNFMRAGLGKKNGFSYLNLPRFHVHSIA